MTPNQPLPDIEEVKARLEEVEDCQAELYVKRATRNAISALTTLQSRLDALKAEVREVLEPFAIVAREYTDGSEGRHIGDEFPGSEVLYGHEKPNLGHFRRAAALLATLGPKP
jgi:hypothetical protein